MLASGAMTSTPGVITSFSCIGLLLLYAVPSARVAASRIETPRTSSGAARVVRERLALSAARYQRPGACGPTPHGPPAGGTSRAPLQRVADLLRLREACSSERGRTDRHLSLLPALLMSPVRKRIRCCWARSHACRPSPTPFACLSIIARQRTHRCFFVRLLSLL